MSELSKGVETQRTIQVYDGVTGEDITLQTNFSKWTDVAPLIEAQGFTLTNKNAVLKSTKGILHFPDALVPEGNQIIYLVQAKMKSGATKATKAFSDMSYNELRRAFKELRDSDSSIASLGGNPEAKALIAALEKGSGLSNLKGNSKVVKTQKEEIVKNIKEKAKSSEPKLEEKIEALEAMLGNTIEGLKDILASLTGTKKTPTKLVTILTEEKQQILPSEKKLLSKAELAREFNNL